MTDPIPLTAVALVCTLSPSPTSSSSQLMAEQVLAELATHHVTTSLVRVVDHDVHPGVGSDMGAGDAWPAIRARVMAADIVVLATPTWMGQPSGSPSPPGLSRTGTMRLPATSATTRTCPRPHRR